MEACAPCSYAYASAHARQQLDFYTPTAGRLSTPRPLIIWFHGGAWLSGSQSEAERAEAGDVDETEQEKE